MLALIGVATYTANHHSTKLRGLEKVKALLKYNPEIISSRDIQGATPLHHAADRGETTTAELLLASKAEVNAKDKRGLTPLQFAVLTGNKDIEEWLRQHGGHE